MTDRQNKNSAKSFKKVLFWVLSVFILLLVAGFLFLEFSWKPLVKDKLEKAVLKGSNGLYHLKINSINANFFAGNIELVGTELLPDTQVYKHFITLKTAPDKLFRLRVKVLRINGLPFLEAYFYRRLKIDSISIINPDLTLISQNQPYNKTAKKQKPKTLYELTSSIFKKIDVGGIFLKKINFVYLDKNGKQPVSTVLKNLDIRINQLLIDSTSAKDTTRFLSSKSLEFSLPGYQMATADSLYYLQVKDVYFSTDKRQLLIKNLAFSPRYDKVAFYKKIKVRQDRYDLNFGSISVNQLDLNRFNHGYQIFSKSVKISNGQVEIFTNTNYPIPKDKNLQRANFPQQQLQRLATVLNIDTVFLSGLKVSYSEAEANSGRTGNVFFNDVKGKILNVTNDSIAKKINPNALANLQCRFLNAADLQVNFKFNLQSKNGSFRYNASLGTVNTPVINQLTVPLALVQLKSGTVQKLDFNVDADNNEAKGTMNIYYTDLQIEALKRETGQKNLEKKEIVSALANTFVINTNNPENGKFRVGEIQYTRQDDVSFFGSIWKSLLSGIKSSAGASAAKKQVKQSTVKHRTGVNKVLHKVGSFLGISKK